MLSIPKKYKRSELAIDIAYQRVLISQKLGQRAQNMVALLWSNWKLVRINKNIRNGLFDQLQSFIIILKKDTRYCALTLDVYTKILGHGIIQIFLSAEQNYRIQ